MEIEHRAYLREHEDVQPDEDFKMNLGVRERRKLYLQSGGKCSKCNRILFLKEDNTDIAEECHISSHKKNYPSIKFTRYDPNLTEKERDKSSNNAILLCCFCHKIIDNPENTQYTVEVLRKIKTEHENKVSSTDKDYAKELYELIIYREKKEKTAEKLEYSKKLYEELQRRIHGSIIFVCNDSNWENLHIQLSNPNLVQTTSEYSSKLNDYLKSEHKKVWDTINEIEPNIDQHNLDLQAFLSNLKSKMRDYLQKTFEINEWKGENLQTAPQKYYKADGLSWIEWHVQYYYKNEKMFVFSRKPIDWGVGQQYLLELSGVPIVISDNSAEIEEIEKELLGIFNEAISNDEFTKLKKDFVTIEGKLDGFEKDAPKIISDLKKGHLGNYKPIME